MNRRDLIRSSLAAAVGAALPVHAVADRAIQVSSCDAARALAESDEFARFCQAVVRQMSEGMGIPFEKLAKAADGAAYSMQRLALEATFWPEHLRPRFVDPVISQGSHSDFPGVKTPVLTLEEFQGIKNGFLFGENPASVDAPAGRCPHPAASTVDRSSSLSGQRDDLSPGVERPAG